MERENFNHGFSDEAWEEAKDQARKAMYEVAADERLISYSDLVARISAVRLDAHDVRLAHLLGQVAIEDDEKGKGLTTVVVVHKSGDGMPGDGFFEMAEGQERDISDRVECWMAELKSVHHYWGKL